MLKKTITFFDYNEKQCTEDFYFNLTVAELTEMELTTKGGMEALLKQIIASRDGAAIIEVFTDLLAKSYGKKSEDGRRFIKSPILWEEFQQIGAYDVLFVQLVTNADAAAEFINGLLPSKEMEKLQAVQKKETDLSQKSGAVTLQPSPIFRPELIQPSPFIENVPLPDSENKVLADYTDAEIVAMDRNKLLRLMRVSQEVALGEMITKPTE